MGIRDNHLINPVKKLIKKPKKDVIITPGGGMEWGEEDPADQYAGGNVHLVYDSEDTLLMVELNDSKVLLSYDEEGDLENVQRKFAKTGSVVSTTLVYNPDKRLDDVYTVVFKNENPNTY